MVQKKKNTLEAKGKVISDYRLRLGLTQEEFVKRAREKYQLKISLRNLQKAEGSKMVGEDTLASIAFFLASEGKGADSYVSLEKITKNPLKEEINFHDIFFPNRNKEKNKISISVFRKKIKEEKKSKTETVLLERIETREQLSNIIKKSKLRKNFYESNYNNDQVKIISKILKEIKEIHDSIYNVKEFWEDNTRNEDTSSYDDVNAEIANLTLQSGFSEIIAELKKANLNLYAGNYLHHYFDIVPKDFSKIEKVDVGDSVLHERGEFVGTIKCTNWAIFYFSSSSERVMNFNYDNEWFTEKLEAIIENDPFTGTGDDWQIEQGMEDTYGADYGYYSNFYKERVSFSSAKIAALEDHIKSIEENDYPGSVDPPYK